MSWQRANIVAAANFIREVITRGNADARARVVYDGLLEVLEPARRTTRLQKESAQSAKAAVTASAARDRRTGADRRRKADRRRIDLGSPTGVDRRAGKDRRTGADRRG